MEGLRSSTTFAAHEQAQHGHYTNKADLRNTPTRPSCAKQQQGQHVPTRATHQQGPSPLEKGTDLHVALACGQEGGNRPNEWGEGP